MNVRSLVFGLALSLLAGPALAEDADLDDAVTSLRRVGDTSRLPSGEKGALEKRLGGAWDVIRGRGAAGLARVRAEATAMREAGVEDRHVIAVATPEDLDRLLAVRAAACRRLSDECLDDIRILDTLVKRIGRTRFRAEPGLCREARPPVK